MHHGCIAMRCAGCGEHLGSAQKRSLLKAIVFIDVDPQGIYIYVGGLGCSVVSLVRCEEMSITCSLSSFFRNSCYERQRAH